MSLTIELSPEASAIISRLGSHELVLEAIRGSLGLELQSTLSHIVEKRLTGKGPFPVEQHRLGERSKLYRKSVRTAAPVINGTVIEGGIGANVKYAGVHEFGGTFQRVSKAGSVRLATDRKGNRLGQRSNMKLAVFARRGRKSAVNVPYAGGKRFTVTYPARAPISTGIEDRLTDIGGGISQGIINAWKGTNPA